MPTATQHYMTYEDIFDLCPVDVARRICEIAMRERKLARMEFVKSNQLRHDFGQHHATPITPEQREILQKVDEAALKREYDLWLASNRPRLVPLDPGQPIALKASS